MRLEQENDDLAHELVSSKIALRKDLDNVSLLDSLTLFSTFVLIAGLALAVPDIHTCLWLLVCVVKHSMSFFP